MVIVRNTISTLRVRLVRSVVPSVVKRFQYFQSTFSTFKVGLEFLLRLLYMVLVRNTFSVGSEFPLRLRSSRWRPSASSVARWRSPTSRVPQLINDYAAKINEIGKSPLRGFT
jgi:hypothetical protein